jgi:uncharacterized protein (TIGR03118 family)
MPIRLVPKLKHIGLAAIAAGGITIGLPVFAEGTAYVQHNLVSDGFVQADHIDPNLQNGWGVAFNPTGAVWVVNNGTGTSTLYDGLGQGVGPTPGHPLVVSIPSGSVAGGTGTPTGTIFNGSTDFVISQGAVSGSAKFLFSSEDGVITAWAPNVDLLHALRIIDNSSNAAVYKGLAISANGTGTRLYATDFRHARVDVWDGTFTPVTIAGAFHDPNLPAGYAPFGIQAINGDLYVTYAKQDESAHDEIDGPGLGFVSVFDPNGRFLRRLVSGGRLNAPWGLALAPAGFGEFGGRLLIGNFGDGHIDAYDVANGEFVGRLRDTQHRALNIDRIWGFAFGNGVLNQSVDTLYFAAGPNDEKHGLYGSITAVSNRD